MKRFLCLLSVTTMLLACGQPQLEDSVYQLDLCVAVNDGTQNAWLRMDNGGKLYPTRDLSQDVQDGARYKIHYCRQGNEADDSTAFQADVLELYPIEVIPMISALDSLESQLKRDPLAIDRFWLGGGYVNATLSFFRSDQETEHTIRLVRESLADSVLTLDLMHFSHDDEPQYETSATLSFPLESIKEYPDVHTLGIRVAISENGNTVLKTYLLEGGCAY